MSRGARRERRTPGGAGRAAAAPAGRRRALRTGLLVLVAAAVGAATWWAAARWRPAPPAARETLSVAALTDSMAAADEARDWARLCHWLQRLRETDPGNPSYRLALGMARHNLAWAGAPSARERSATRTSLERITTERRVLAMMDSSAASARTPDEWAQALFRAGTLYENLGLATDALRIFTGVHLRRPGATPALAHAAVLMARLRDPSPAAAPVPPPAAGEPGGP